MSEGNEDLTLAFSDSLVAPMLDVVACSFISESREEKCDCKLVLAMNLSIKVPGSSPGMASHSGAVNPLCADSLLRFRPQGQSSSEMCFLHVAPQPEDIIIL